MGDDRGEPGSRELLINAFVGLADTWLTTRRHDVLGWLAGYGVELLAADAAGIRLADGRRRAGPGHQR